MDGRKRGFSVPMARWLRDEARGLGGRRALAGGRRRQGVFDPPAVAALLDEHVSGRSDQSRQLWGLLVFGLWHDRVLGAAA